MIKERSTFINSLPVDLSDLGAISTHSYMQVAAISLLYYDHILTLPAEVSHIWSQAISPNTFLFLLNRYTAFLGNIAVSVIFFSNLTNSVESCSAVAYARQALLVLSQVIVSGVFSHHLWAVSGP
ncbi:hypothetical protein B0F90DRAFT_1703614 [Multifurca ochricompacta]|uniref:DUF6533 domain-containing protein n=1 Tax=Multifurca ochricompacta TaxID=376703 RepID=A0AAD4QQN9_9AGAM|nr:hypothetical protein B0F90DRAFT_1703614 [Multifurca ochricompacta]